MSKTTKTEEIEESVAPAGFAPAPLLSNSYNFQDLLKASEHIEGLKTDEGRANALGAIATKSAVFQDVLTGIEAPALPEGTEMGKTEDANGREVTAPVTVPTDAE